MKMNGARTPRLLILGVHGLDWNLIAEKLLNGTLPHLATCVSQGVSGPLHSVYPLNGGSGWTSLATGKRAFRHGSLTPTPSGSSMQPEELSRPHDPTLWNILSQAGISCSVIGWPGMGKAEKIRGLMVSPSFFEANEPFVPEWPIPEGSVAPSAKAKLFSSFRLHPDNVPESWCGTFVPTYFSEEPEVAVPLTTVRSALAADRGKLDVAIHWAQKEEWNVLGICLSGLETIGCIGLPYHSLPVSREPLYQAEIFGGLVDRVYEWYDIWINELLTALPSDTNILIVSDHGVLNNSRRRRSPEGERFLSLYLAQGERGCLIASGPAFAKQIPIRRATLLDICPTVLSLYGIRQEREMDGVVLDNILASPQPPEKIINWSQALVGIAKRRDINSLELQELCRLGMAFLDAGQLLEAVDSLSTAWKRMPASLEIAAALAAALLFSGHRMHAATVLQTALQEPQGSSLPWICNMGFRFDWHQEGQELASQLSWKNVLGTVAQWLATPDETSANQLFELFRATPESFLLSLICGFAASWLGYWKDAQILLGRASALNTSDPESLVEIAHIHLRRGRPKAALKSARLAMEKAPLHLRGTIALAKALLALGHVKEAREEAQKATRFIEQRRSALLILARISQSQGDAQKASRYRRIARRVKRKLAAVGTLFSLPEPMPQPAFSSIDEKALPERR